jgi:hypothetical protein
VDEEQWPLVEAIFFGLQHSGNVKELHRSLVAAGWYVDISTVYRISRSRIYCNGVWSCHWRGEIVHEQTIELGRPIPAEVFERNRNVIGRAA